MRNKNKVLIDGFFFGKPYGFGRYIEELVYSFVNNNANIDFTVALPSDVLKTLKSDFPYVTKGRVAFPLWEQFVLPSLARDLGCNVLHHPYNTASIGFYGLKRIVTVHDLFFIDYRSKGSIKDRIYSQYSRLAYKMGTRRCDTIVAISKATSQRLEENGMQPSVIYNTVDQFIKQHTPENVDIISRTASGQEAFFFHRGGYEDHRNTRTVIEAFRTLRLEAPSVSLKILGAPLGANFFKTAKDEGIHFLPRLDDAEVANLYRSSLGVVAVALREGFGLPVLEGFGFGAPVITSNRPPMIEVAGNAAMLVDPTQISQITDAMRHLLIVDNRISLIKKGNEQFLKFGSKRFSEAYVQAYEHI